MKFYLTILIIGFVSFGQSNVIKRDVSSELLINDEVKDTDLKDNGIPIEETTAASEIKVEEITFLNTESEQTEQTTNSESESDIELQKSKTDDIDLTVDPDNLRLDSTEQNEIFNTEGGDGLRQSGGATQRPGIIQQLVQNNPISNFIQNIRPRPTTQSNTSNDAVATPTQPPNILQQGVQGLQQTFQTLQQNLQQGVQGLQQNFQSLINPNAVQSANSTAGPIPPFNLLTNLFNPPNATNQSNGNGPIQNIFGGIFGNNRDSTPSNLPPTTTATAEPSTPSTTSVNIASNIIDEVQDRPDSNENEHDIYVGDDDSNTSSY